MPKNKLMFNLTERVREEHGLLSKIGLTSTFCIPEAYAAASLQDFLENRGSINSSWKSRVKINSLHAFVALVFIKTCRYQQHNPGFELPPPERWRALDAEIYANEHIRSVYEGTPVDMEQATTDFLNRIKNGRLYDTASMYPVLARITIPQDIPLYNIWLRYFPQRDFAAIDSFNEHDTRKIYDRSAHTALIKGLLPALQPA